MFVEGQGGATVERTAEVAAGSGKVDPASGVPFVGPLPIPSLVGGSVGVFVEHPVLGSAAWATVAAPGTVNALRLDWTTFDGSAAFSARYQSWLGEAKGARRARAGTAPGLVLVIGGGLAAGTLAVAGLLARERAAEQWTQYKGALSTGTVAEAQSVFQTWQATSARSQTLLVAGGVSGGVAGVGIVVTLASGGRAAKLAAGLEPWPPAGF